MTETTPPNKKKQGKQAIIALLAVIIFMGAYGYYELVLKQKINGSTLIDNPTASAISVTIDAETYEVAANTFLKIDIAQGTHKITCKDFNISDENLVVEPTKFGVINPTKSKYVIYNIIYTEKDLRYQFKPYQVEGREIYSLLGEPELTTDLFIADRTQGKGNLDDVEPSIETYSRISQDYAYLMKIFRLKDFFEFYDKNNK